MSRMVLRFSAVLFFFGFVHSNAAPVPFGAGALEKVDAYLLEKIVSSGGEPFSAILVLTEQATVAVSDSATKEEKGREVFETLRDVALRTQVDLLAELDAQGIEYRRFYIRNMVAVYDVDAQMVLALSQRSDIANVYGNPTIREDLPEGSDHSAESEMERRSSAGPGMNLKYIGVDDVWDDLGAFGDGIVIGAQDTGIEWEHPALREQYRGTRSDGTVDHDYNWYDAIQKNINPSSSNSSCGYASEEPCDDNAHGTHTLGTAVGDDGRSNQIGVAPGAKWIGCRNMDDGHGTPVTYAACYEFFLAPFPVGGDPMLDGDPSKAPHVLINSWGCPESEGCFGDELLEVTRQMRRAGILNVVSAGNEGPDCDTVMHPAATYSGESFTVGAISHITGRIADFSSRGPSTYDGRLGIDITAPGINIRSAVPGGGYAGFGWRGTSMAGPHISGVAALIMSAQPNLIGQPVEVANIIRSTAKPKTSSQSCGGISGDETPNHTFGYGVVDAFAAVQEAITNY